MLAGLLHRADHDADEQVEDDEGCNQKNSDNLVNLEKKAFAAVKGLYDDGYGNFTVSRTPDRDFAIDLLFGERYTAEKARIMAPIRIAW